MILYFSGTGNSRYVADRLAELLGEQTFNMEQGHAGMPALCADETLGIVFPVYAWGIPRLVKEFLQAIHVDSSRYVWIVMTCGDDMGYADKELEKALRRDVQAAFSVTMPNTYVCLPGFDVDSPQLARQKRLDTQVALPTIAAKIRGCQPARELLRGALPWLKTYVMGPLFNKFLVTDKYFHISPSCTSCGLCAKQCPKADIAMHSGAPSWLHQDCTGCLRCYHACPRRAIDWGRYSVGKGQNK